MGAFRVVLITASTDKAPELSRALVENRLAGCVNIVERVKSTYWWKGEIRNDSESLLIVKTTTKKVESLIKFVKQSHEYEVPEVISMTIAEGNPDYLDWLDQETAG